MDEEFDLPLQASATANPNSPTELVKSFGPTVVAGVGIVLTRNSPIVSSLFAVALIGLIGVALQPRLKTRKARRLAESLDAKTVADNLPKFKGFVYRFGKFFGGASDTLHNIVHSNLSSTALRDRLTIALGTPTSDFWNTLWTFSLQRLERPAPTLAEFLAEIQEFNFIVSAYGSWCVSQIFDRLPQEAVNDLHESDRRALNEFQQRYAHFLSEYEGFLQDLSTVRPGTKNIGQTFSRAKPFSR